jgi:hypothetical protein
MAQAEGRLTLVMEGPVEWEIEDRGAAMIAEVAPEGDSSRIFVRLHSYDEGVLRAAAGLPREEAARMGHGEAHRLTGRHVRITIEVLGADNTTPPQQAGDE